MSIKKRNILTIKKKESLDLGHLLLYEPYKNILYNFLELATKKEAKNFDPIAKVYHGLLSVPMEIREYYEALLGITSYYQASKGGRGRYIEKKLASMFQFCSLDIKVSQIPFWLTYPDIHKKKGIFTNQGLSGDEKRLISTFNWEFIGETDEESDIGNIIKDKKKIVLMEIKNRVDSGGTAARREIWTSQKFGIIISYLIEDEKIYTKHNDNIYKFTFAEMLLNFDIHNLEMYIGILFDINGQPASIFADKINGFYSSSKEGFEYLTNKIQSSGKFNVLNKDEENLIVEARHKSSGIILICGPAYGDEVAEKLFNKKIPISDLLLLKYDDIWFSQLIAINERRNLLKYGKNYIILFKEILKKDYEARKLYDEFVKSEGSYNDLVKIVNYILTKYYDEFADYFVKDLCPNYTDKEEYLADVIQFVGCVEA